ncbi:MAG: hypothetical protein M3Y81_24350 [Chloroflexota bacterium]|nr:hypothetical protein [Chloroflexota bacterium]
MVGTGRRRAAPVHETKTRVALEQGAGERRPYAKECARAALEQGAGQRRPYTK